MSAGARSGRIERRFAALQSAGRGGLITFVTAGDPDFETSAEILRRLPAAGADFIELGAPFSDPMADGPAIQASSLRALKAGQTMRRTLDMVECFRGDDAETPIILMGYYNPVYAYGVDRFMDDAAGAGVDGLILVDLPPEEAEEALTPARRAGVDVIFLTAPTTDAARLPTVVANAQGFIYHVSVAGVTGTRSAALDDVERAVARIRAATDLPIAVGFGIRTAAQASAIARIADAAVVGSALVQTVAARIEGDGDRGRIADDVCALASELGRAIRATGPEPKVGS